MRLGIAGKGGSGKTSTSWMVLQALAQLGLKPVAVDADYNQHLAAMFGATNNAVKPLAADKDALITHVLGSRSDITPAQFRKATQPAQGSRLLALEGDAFLSAYQHNTAEGVTLMRVGEYPAQDIGQRCYHASTGAVDILLNHLAPTQRPIIIDYTAGVDPFASDITTLLDAVVLVIEPTLKGVEVARQWHELLNDALPLYLVANKITEESDAAWLAQALAPHTLSSVLWLEPHIKNIERGAQGSWQGLSAANQAALLSLWQQLSADLAEQDQAA